MQNEGYWLCSANDELIVVPFSFSGLSMIADRMWGFLLHTYWYDENTNYICKECFAFCAHDELVTNDFRGLHCNIFWGISQLLVFLISTLRFKG